jgi:L-ascorbate metabolism protein UlaG (beta-lactamase superfamily)
MRKPCLHIFATAVACLGLASCAAPCECPSEPASAESPISATPTPDLPKAVGRLHWFGKASILYTGSKMIYFDAENLSGGVPPAGFVLLSHSHHISLESLQKVVKASTIVVISPDVVDSYNLIKDRLKATAATVLDEGETLESDGVTIQAVAAYDETIHPRSNKGMGYVVTIDGERIYFAGGTNYYPEMAGIESDVALYPLYTPEDVAQTAKVLPTQVLILIHCFPRDIASFQSKYGDSMGQLPIMGLALESYNPWH